MTQAEHEHLVPGPGRRVHQQLAVDHLVAVAVVRERADHVGGEVAGSHAHTFVSAAGEWQEEGTRHGRHRALLLDDPAVPDRCHDMRNRD